MENGLRILDSIPLKGSLVRLEKDATAFDSRSNGRRDDGPRYVPRNHDDDRRPFDDRDPRGGYRSDPRVFDSRGPYPGGDRDRDRGYPPHVHGPPPHHFDGPPPRGYDDRGDHRGGPYGGDARGRYRSERMASCGEYWVDFLTGQFSRGHFFMHYLFSDFLG